MLHFLNAHHRRVVLQQQRNGIKVVHVVHHDAHGGRLSRLQGHALRFESNFSLSPVRRSTSRRGSSSSRASVSRHRVVRGHRIRGLHARPRILHRRWRRGLCHARRRRRRRTHIAFAPYLHIRFRPGIQRPQIPLGPFRNAHDARSQHNQNFVFLVINLVVRKEVAQERNFRQARPPVQRTRVGLLKQSAQHARFAFFQANLMLDFALADNRLLNSANRRSPGYRGHFNNHFHADFVIRMHAWSDIHIDADFQVLELRIDQRVDARRAHAHARLKASRGHWHLITDAQLGGLSVNRTNFRILNNLRVRVGQNRVGGDARQRNAIVAAIQMAQLVQRYGLVGSCPGGCSSTSRAGRRVRIDGH